MNLGQSPRTALNLNNSSLPSLESIQIQSREIIENWKEVRDRLLKLIDFDVHTNFGCIQIFEEKDGGMQIGVHGEGPDTKIEGLHYHQERTTFYNFDGAGQVTNASSDLKPYDWDDAFGPIYRSSAVVEEVPFSALKVIEAILSAKT